MLAHLGPRPERSPLIRLRSGQQIPVTLDPGQVAAVIDACGRLRDRFLLTVLAEAGGFSG